MQHAELRGQAEPHEHRVTAARLPRLRAPRRASRSRRRAPRGPSSSLRGAGASRARSTNLRSAAPAAERCHGLAVASVSLRAPGGRDRDRGVTCPKIPGLELAVEEGESARLVERRRRARGHSRRAERACRRVKSNRACSTSGRELGLGFEERSDDRVGTNVWPRSARSARTMPLRERLIGFQTNRLASRALASAVPAASVRRSRVTPGRTLSRLTMCEFVAHRRRVRDLQRGRNWLWSARARGRFGSRRSVALVVRRARRCRCARGAADQSEREQRERRRAFALARAELPRKAASSRKADDSSTRGVRTEFVGLSSVLSVAA